MNMVIYNASTICEFYGQIPRVGDEIVVSHQGEVLTVEKVRWVADDKDLIRTFIYVGKKKMGMFSEDEQYASWSEVWDAQEKYNKVQACLDQLLQEEYYRYIYYSKKITPVSMKQANGLMTIEEFKIARIKELQEKVNARRG